MKYLINAFKNLKNTQKNIKKVGETIEAAQSDVSETLDQKWPKIISISQKQADELKENIENKEMPYRDRKTNLSAFLSDIWISGSLLDCEYDEEEWKFIVPYETPDNRSTAYIIDVKEKKIKDIRLGVYFGNPFWRDLEFIIPNVGFVTSAYAQSNHAWDYQIYDFDWKLLISGNYRDKGPQNLNQKVARIKQKIEESGVK